LFVSFFHGAKYKDGDGDGKIKRQFRAGKHLSDALTACRIDQPKPIGKLKRHGAKLSAKKFLRVFVPLRFINRCR
jgi:hypothetical protein